jgi:hypothetical protein
MSNLTIARLDTTGHLIVPPQVGASYTVSLYESANSSVEVARSPIVYLNGKEPSYRKVLTASPIDASNSVSVGAPVQITCSMPDKPQGVFAIPYKITSNSGATDGYGNVIGAGNTVGTTDGYGNVLSYVDGYGNTVGYTAAQLGVTSLTGVFNLDYTGNPIDGLVTITVNSGVTLTPQAYVAVSLANNPAVKISLSIFNNIKYALSSSTNVLVSSLVSPDSVCTITVNCINAPDGTLIPYALACDAGIAPSDLDVPLTGDLTVTNSVATLNIKSLTNVAKVVYLKINDITTSISFKLTSFADTSDGAIVGKITHADVINPAFDLSQFNYTYNVTPVYVKVAKGRTFNYSADISFDTSGNMLSEGTSISIGLIKGSIVNYSWTATSNSTTFKDAVDSLVAVINSATDGYTAVSKGTVGNVSTIRISRTGLDYFVALTTVTLNTLSVGDTEIAYKLDPMASSVSIGGLVKIVTPDNYLVASTPTPNPYAGNTGVWKVKSVVGDYVVVGSKMPYAGTITVDTSFGTYTILK